MPLDTLGQRTILKAVTNFCICYPEADLASQITIIVPLRTGFERPLSAFPLVAGQVVNEGTSGEDTAMTSSNDPALLSVMGVLRKASFPSRC
jgi:hypothetical protein